LAVTELPVVELNPAAGLQEYVEAPDAVNTVELPLQIEVEGLTVTVGLGFTVTVTVAELVHPFVAVPTTV